MQLDQALTSITQNPFAIITIIGAPAILTNASSILGLTTSGRLMRSLDTISQIEKKLDDPVNEGPVRDIYLAQARLAQRQSRHFLWAMKASYASLAAFAFSCFLALIGSVLLLFSVRELANLISLLSLASGSFGVLGLVWSSVELIVASQLTLKIMSKNLEILKIHRNIVI